MSFIINYLFIFFFFILLSFFFNFFFPLFSLCSNYIITIFFFFFLLYFIIDFFFLNFFLSLKKFFNFFSLNSFFSHLTKDLYHFLIFSKHKTFKKESDFIFIYNFVKKIKNKIYLLNSLNYQINSNAIFLNIFFLILNIKNEFSFFLYKNFFLKFKEFYFLVYFFFFLILFSIRIFFIDFYIIPSSSMYPNFLIGDFIICLKYLNKDINNLLGKAVVFKAPESVGNYYNTFWLKRIIASSNDFIEINNNAIRINNYFFLYKKLNFSLKFLDYFKENSWLIFNSFIIREKNFFNNYYIIINKNKEINNFSKNWSLFLKFDQEFPGLIFNDLNCIVKRNNFFVLGDNRDSSNDSRFWGGLKKDNLISSNFFTLFSFDFSNILYKFFFFYIPYIRNYSGKICF